VLGGFGFYLPRRLDVRNKSKMDIQDIVLAEIGPQLPDGLEKGLSFDVADGSADFDDGHVQIIACNTQNRRLDLIGYVGDDLHGSPEIIAPTLLGDDRMVDPARGEIVGLAKMLIEEPFVMTEIEIGLRPVVGHIDLAVLEGVHGSGIDIDVRIEFQDGHVEAPGLE